MAEFSLTLSWDYEECVVKHFRVEGQCESPPFACNSPCPEVPDQLQSFVVNLTGCNVQDICRKLRSKGITRGIRSIHEFNQPVSLLLPPSDPSKPADCLILDVTPELEDCEDCCDIILDEVIDSTSGFTSHAMVHFSHSASGDLFLSGSFTSDAGISSLAGGLVSLTGGFFYSNTYYRDTVSGVVSLSGSFNAFCSHYESSANGTVVLGSSFSYGTSAYIVPASGLLTFNNLGTYNQGFLGGGNGSVLLYGSTFAEPNNYFYEYGSSGTVVLGGNFGITSSYHIANIGGTIVLGGGFGGNTNFKNHAVSGTVRLSSSTRVGIGLDAAGVVSLGGSFGGNWHIILPVAGLVVIDGESGVQSTAIAYPVSGRVVLGSQTTYLLSDLGTFAVLVGTVDEGDETGVIFSETPVDAITVVIPTVDVLECCSEPVPALLDLRHNLEPMLRRFLLRNGLNVQGDIDDDTVEVLKLQYRPKLGIWQSNIHLSGLSAVVSGAESWDILFEFGCESSLWRFGVFIRRKLPMQDDICRLVMEFEPEEICDGAFNGINIEYNYVSPATDAVFYDESGLITNSPYFDPTVLKFNIKTSTFITQQTFAQSLEEQLAASLI